jgi:DNA-directed RNA polymerase subunit RPC12/RpoP
VPAALLKRFVCAGCGATGPMPSLTPFIQCRSCGVIGDFDLGTARRNPDWAKHEALLHHLYAQARRDQLDAIYAKDRPRCVAIHARVLGELMAQCPSVYPKRVTLDATYRDHWIAYQANQNTNLELEPEVVEGGRHIAELCGRLMNVPWTMDVLAPLFDVCVKHFELQDALLLSRPPGFPPNFVRHFLRRLGCSMTAQEWLPRISLADQHAMVAYLGLASEYVSPGAAGDPHCGGCGALLLKDSSSCITCKRAIDRTRGTFDCASCGVVVLLIAGAPRAACPYCSAEMRETQKGIEQRLQDHATLARVGMQLGQACRHVGREKPIRIDVLDGPIRRRDLPWRMVSLRAWFSETLQVEFFENADAPDATSHTDTIGWVEAQKQVHGTPYRVRRYREHPRCLTPPVDAAELERRRVEIDPPRAAPLHAAIHGLHGFACEVAGRDEVVRLALVDQRALVARLGLSSEYVSPDAADTPHCGGCGLILPKDAASCTSCKRAIDRARGAFECAPCGAVVRLVSGAQRAACPYCSTEMRETGIGLEQRRRNAATTMMDTELSGACAQVGKDRPLRIDVLDGTVTRRDLPWRMVSLRAAFSETLDVDFFENTDYPDASSHPETMAWVEARKDDHGTPYRVLRYREHPRCMMPPADGAEIERRRGDVDPSRAQRLRAARHGPNGYACEIVIGDEVVRLAVDDDGNTTATRDALRSLGVLPPD